MKELAKDIAIHYQTYLATSIILLIIGTIIKPKGEIKKLKEILLGILYNYLLIGGLTLGLLGILGFFAQIVKFTIK